MYSVIKSVTECVAELPDPFAFGFLAVTVTSNGELVLSVYV